MNKLKKVEFHLDIFKYKFKVISIKYLGFIIKVGKGVYIDPKKVKIIKEWEIFIIIKGIRSFFNFINFY